MKIYVILALYTTVRHKLRDPSSPLWYLSKGQSVRLKLNGGRFYLIISHYKQSAWMLRLIGYSQPWQVLFISFFTNFSTLFYQYDTDMHKTTEAHIS